MIHKRRKYDLVTKEENKLLPHGGPPVVRWDWDFFSEWWKYRGKQLQPTIWGYMRYANAVSYTLGPFTLIVAARWLNAPARYFYPEVFDE